MQAEVAAGKTGVTATGESLQGHGRRTQQTGSACTRHASPNIDTRKTAQTFSRRASDAEASLLAVQNELLAAQKDREDRFAKVRCNPNASQTRLFWDDAFSWLSLDPFSVTSQAELKKHNQELQKASSALTEANDESHQRENGSWEDRLKVARRMQEAPRT